MAAKLRRYIDPTTRDYVVESGGFKGDSGISTQILIAWGMELGSCPVFPELGSRLHRVKHADERGRREAEAYGTEAIGHLKGKVNDLAVTATLSTLLPGCISLEAVYRLGDVEQRVPYTARVGA